MDSENSKLPDSSKAVKIAKTVLWSYPLCHSLGIQIMDLRLRVEVLGFLVHNSGCRVQGFVTRVDSLDFRISG